MVCHGSITTAGDSRDYPGFIFRDDNNDNKDPTAKRHAQMQAVMKALTVKGSFNTQVSSLQFTTRRSRA